MGPEPLSLSDFLSLRRPHGDVVVDFDGLEVALTSLDRVYFPAEGITKFEVLRYYVLMWPCLEPHLRGRPAILQRYPRGIAMDHAPRFFQHNLTDAPPYVRTHALVGDDGRVIHYAVYSELPALLFLVNRAVIEQHAW